MILYILIDVFLILDQLSEAKHSEYSVKYELLIISEYWLFNLNRISTKWCPRKLEPFWLCNMLEKHCIYSVKGKTEKKKQNFKRHSNASFKIDLWVLAMKSSTTLETDVFQLFFLTTRTSGKIPAETTTDFFNRKHTKNIKLKYPLWIMLTISEHAVWNAGENHACLIRFGCCVPQTIPTSQAGYMLPWSSHSTV